MDLRSCHQAQGKEKLCFSLTCPLGSGSPEGVVKAGAPELEDKGPLVPTLPFPLRKPRKAHKYLRLSRKKFPPRGPNLESHSHPRELFLQEAPAPDVLQAASEWEPAEQPPEEEGKGAPPGRPSGLERSLESSGPAGLMPRAGVGGSGGPAACQEPGTRPGLSEVLPGRKRVRAPPPFVPSCAGLAWLDAQRTAWCEGGRNLHAAARSHLPHLLVSAALHLSVCLSPVAVADADLAEGPPPWTPALPTSEVTVTDITANSITVTFREAQAAEGFFRDRSGKF